MWGGLWLLASLGLRLVGLPRALQALRGGAPAVVLAVIALSGWPLRLLFRVSADGQFDEAVYFTVQSGALLWLFAVWGVVGIAERTRRPVTIGVSAVLLALPTTAEFVWRKATTAPERIPPAVMRATSWLARETRPGEVVLQPSASRYPPPPVVFIGRRVPYAEYLPYLTQFAPEALLAERLRDVRRFFKDKDAGLAERWHARFVCAFGHETAVEDSPRLELAFEDDPVRIYRIRQP
jgi:hypothetical protein